MSRIRVMGSLLGELLRNRRIASDEEIIEVCDECTALEFQSIGYSRREVMKAMQEAKNKITTNYSGMFVKFDEEEEVNFSYGGSLEYNGLYRYQEVLAGFINFCKPSGAPNLLLVPGKKLKNLAYTKSQYLKRQVEEIKLGENKVSKN